MDESPRQLLRDACEAVADWINGAPCPDPAYFRSVINRLDALAESTSAAAIAFRYCERHDNESLAHGPTDDYARPYQERCDTCYGEWHGLPAFGCPGAYATPEQHAEYLQSHRRNIGHIPIWPTYTYYESFAPSTAVNDQALEGYTHIGYVDSDGIQHDNRLGVIRAICQSAIAFWPTPSPHTAEWVAQSILDVLDGKTDE